MHYSDWPEGVHSFFITEALSLALVTRFMFMRSFEYAVVESLASPCIESVAHILKVKSSLSFLEGVSSA